MRARSCSASRCSRLVAPRASGGDARARSSGAARARGSRRAGADPAGRAGGVHRCPRPRAGRRVGRVSGRSSGAADTQRYTLGAGRPLRLARAAAAPEVARRWGRSASTARTSCSRARATSSAAAARPACKLPRMHRRSSSGCSLANARQRRSQGARRQLPLPQHRRPRLLAKSRSPLALYACGTRSRCAWRRGRGGRRSA